MYQLCILAHCVHPQCILTYFCLDCVHPHVLRVHLRVFQSFLFGSSVYRLMYLGYVFSLGGGLLCCRCCVFLVLFVCLFWYWLHVLCVCKLSPKGHRRNLLPKRDQTCSRFPASSYARPMHARCRLRPCVGRWSWGGGIPAAAGCSLLYSRSLNCLLYLLDFWKVPLQAGPMTRSRNGWDTLS